MADPKLSSNTCANCGTPIYRRRAEYPWRHDGGRSMFCAGRGVLSGPTAKPVTT